MGEVSSLAQSPSGAILATGNRDGRIGLWDAALGQAMRTLVDRHQTAGHHRVHWDGRDQRGEPVGTGIYFSRLQAGPVVHAGKMVVVR